MSDSELLDKVYNWAMSYSDRVLPRDADRRFYDEAVDEVLAILDAREAWRAGAVDGPAWHAARRARREALARLHDALGVSDILKVL